MLKYIYGKANEMEAVRKLRVNLDTFYLLLLGVFLFRNFYCVIFDKGSKTSKKTK